MPHPDNGLATNKTVREVVSAVEVLGTANLATEVTLNSILTKLASVINASDEIKATITGDIEIGSVQVDNVQLIDGDGRKLVYTADGESKVTIADGKDVALGTTTDADTELTVIGRLKKILATLEGGITTTESTPLTSIGATIGDGDNVALGTTTDANTESTVIGMMKAVKDKLDYMIGLDEITTMLSGDISVNDTTATELKVGASKLADRKRVVITNNGAYNIKVLESESADGLLILTGTTLVLTYSGDLWLKSVTGTFNVNIAEIA